MPDIHSVDLPEEVKKSALYSDDLAPTSLQERTWTTWDLAAIWVGMAVCIPTYILASYMIKSGISWQMALLIIGLANVIITVPMVLNGHAGVKYGIPFPVVGRASFGTKGIHLASVVRAIVACGWFGVQTWVGGLAVYAIWQALINEPYQAGLDTGKFVGFGIFWVINIFFIWKGTESIKWLEKFAAPILIGLGIFLIIWGSRQAGSFETVLEKGKQLETPSALIALQEDGTPLLKINPFIGKNGESKVEDFQLRWPSGQSSWIPVAAQLEFELNALLPADELTTMKTSNSPLQIQFRAGDRTSSLVSLQWPQQHSRQGFGATIWGYVLWLTAMVGFWATMSLSIADITRYARSQRSQVIGQFMGLPGTMILYSFVGIFVTFAAVVNFDDIIITEDAPWDPVSFLARFENPTAVIVSQFFMLIATLSTNIAANVIAPANAFSNLMPKKISFRAGGVITGIIGILICPWWLLDEISSALIFVSGLLGPVLGILLADYYIVRRTKMDLVELYRPRGIYAFGGSGFNPAAMWALLAGVVSSLIGYWVPALSFLYNLSWFSGFLISFTLYLMLMGTRSVTPASR